MEIDTMPAGRAMDVLVAGRVMDRLVVKACSVLSLGFAEARGEIPSVNPPRCVTMGIKEDDDVLWTGKPVPAYSTDIATAWDIIGVVRMRTGRAFFLQSVAGTWRATFRFILGGRLDCCGYADTAPLAICRAALAVVEQDHSMVKR